MTTAQEYARRMATYARGQTPELTDLQPGSIYRSLLEALGQELELIDSGMVEATQAAIREAAYRLWAFDRRAASAASGVVRFTATATISSAISLPAGTQVRVPGTDKVYRTASAATFPAGAAGSTLDVLVSSIGAGTIYNTAAATIREFITPPSPNLSVSNPAAFINGRDEETDDERLARFATFVRSLQRATGESIAYAAEQATVVDGSGLVTERVTHAAVVDLAAGVGRCYIANGTTTAASAALIAAANAYVQAYKAAGVTFQTQAASLTAANVTVAVKLGTSYTLAMVQASIEAAITGLIRDLKIGQILYVEQLDAAILSVPGVINLTRSSPAANIDPTTGGAVVLGTITLSTL